MAFFNALSQRLLSNGCASLAEKKSEFLPVLPHISDGLTETGVRFYFFLFQLCRKPYVQPLHHGTAVSLVKAQPFLGRHALFPRQLIIMIDLTQSFQHVTAFGGKVWRYFYKAGRLQWVRQ